MKKLYIIPAVLLSAVMLLTACGDSGSSTASSDSSSMDVEPIGINDKNPYKTNIYKGVLLEDADFDTVKVKITDIELDEEHIADTGDTVTFEYYDKINETPRRVSKYLVSEVFKKGVNVRILFTADDAELTKDDEGNLFIKHAARNSGWQLEAEGQTNETPKKYLDDNGEPIYITEEEFKALKG